MKIKRILKNIIRDSLRFILPKLWYIKLRFYLTHGYKLNLENPKTWNEKIQHRKFNCDNEYLSKFVDKLTVRDYVKEVAGEEYLIPLLGYYEKITPVDIEKLPKSFVIKTSNGGGGENVKVIKDKNKENIENLCKEFNRYLKSNNDAIQCDELFYTIQKPHIIIEKLLLDEQGNVPMDLKIHTFSSSKEENKYIIQVDLSRFKNHMRDWYDENWNLLELKQTYKRSFKNLPKPKNFKKMKELSKLLASEFKYCRVDLYNINGKIYFGELTFTHGSGWEKFEPQEWDYRLGKIWEMEK